MTTEQPDKVDVEIETNGERVILRIYDADGAAIVELTMRPSEAAIMSARLSTCAYAIAFGGAKCDQ